MAGHFLDFTADKFDGGRAFRQLARKTPCFGCIEVADFSTGHWRQFGGCRCWRRTGCAGHRSSRSSVGWRHLDFIRLQLLADAGRLPAVAVERAEITFLHGEQSGVRQ